MICSREVRIRLCVGEDASILARLHRENVSDSLDIQLLTVYYRACFASKRSFCVCAELDGTIIGYIGVISDRMGLLRTALSRHSMTLIRCILQRPVISLELAQHIWKWIRFGALSHSQTRLQSWEYRPLVVTEEYRGRRIAQLLLAAADDLLRSKGVTQVHLWVARDNVSARRAYEHSGFTCSDAARPSLFLMLKTLPSGALTHATTNCISA